VVLCVEGVQPHTPLTRAILADYGDDASKVFDFSNTASPADFGSLAPQVVTGAKAGDPVATTVMQAGADYIAQSLTALGYQTGEVLCLTGGLGPHYADFLPPDFTKSLIAPKGSALDGAVLLAAKMEPTP
jgi:glucosamine kinase